MTGEDWESAFHRANALWHSGRRDDAIAALHAARVESATQGDAGAEAFLASVLGSFRSILGDTKGALREYQSAVDCEPGNPHWRLALAEYLLSIGEAELALREVRASIDLIPTTERSTLHAARSLEGICLVAWGEIEEARAAFLLATEPDLIDGLHASSYDLRLVDEMRARSLESPRCEHYLEIVVARAEAESQPEVRERASGVLRRMKAPGKEG